jgi:tRNA dimethylallyltransferase
MYDVVNPDDEFSVSHYIRLASEVINNIHNRGKLPVVVGGTGLYIRSLISPPASIDVPRDVNLRKELSLLNLTRLQERVRRNFPHVWQVLNTSDRANPRRLIRKIEIAEYSIKSKVTLTKTRGRGNLSKEDVLVIGLTADLPVLYRAIDSRVDIRVRQGIEKEIAGLLQSGYTWNLEALNTLGYKEWRPWFNKSFVRTRELKMKCIQAWKYDEHAYARRQLTWFRKEKEINWFSVIGSGWEEKVREAVKKWYTSD